MLTRAAALFVADNPEKARRQLTVRPFAELRRHVVPHLQFSYKTAPGYWNPKTSTVSIAVLNVLKEFARRY